MTATLPTDLAIRYARPDDVPAIHAIYSLEVLEGTASWELEPPSLEEMASRFAAQHRGPWPWLVGELDGRLVGYSYGSSYRPRPGYRFTVENSVYTARGFRGRGIARTLLGRLVEECAARGGRQMVAVIGDSANEGSIRLHAACGFTRVALLPSIGFKFGRWLDSVMMQRALGAGDGDTALVEPGPR